MREMSRGMRQSKLIRGIPALYRADISAHCVNCGQYSRTEVPVALLLAHGISKESEISALLHGHLVVF